MDIEAFKKVIEEMGEFIETRVKVGLTSRENILDEALDVYGDEFIPALLRPEAEKIIDNAIENQLMVQKEWPEETDCDRLDGAFAELEENRIVAIQNAICCQSCTMEEVWIEIEEMQKTGKEVRGYTFFHEQDTEAALTSQNVYLAYGSLKEGKEEALKIGHEVKDQLETNGFEVQWNGEIRQRIKVNLKWQKRWTE